MKYIFVERTDDGIITIATVSISKGGMVVWKGHKALNMKSLLADTTWRQLGDVSFDETKDEHWEM